MQDQDNSTGSGGLRAWWMDPPRTGMARVLAPWEYRHLRFYGVGRLLGGAVATSAGLICAGYGVWGWAAFFLAIGGLNLGGGYWELSLSRSR